MTQLRRQMLEELERRNYSANTIRSYVRAVEEYARYFKRSPEKLGLDEIRSYQAHLIGKRKLASNTVAQRLAALRFLYVKTLRRGWDLELTPYPKSRLGSRRCSAKGKSQGWSTPPTACSTAPS